MSETETEPADEQREPGSGQHPFARTIPTYLKAGWTEADARTLPGGR